MNFFRRIWRPGALREAALAPQRPFFAIGDVHGCSGALEAALDWIAAQPDAAAPVVVLGDCIDRGPDSAAVLRRLAGLRRERPDLVCLRGNHEEMLLGFLDDPLQHGALWLRAGGTRTLRSFGLDPGAAGPDQLAALRDALAAAIGQETRDWLLSWPRLWQSGNIVAAHAGLDPALPPARQDPAVLTWGAAACQRGRRSDGLFVLHGHVVTERPGLRQGRINLDSGAYRSGRLTVARLGPAQLQLKTIDRFPPDGPQMPPPPLPR